MSKRSKRRNRHKYVPLPDSAVTPPGGLPTTPVGEPEFVHVLPRETNVVVNTLEGLREPTVDELHTLGLAVGSDPRSLNDALRHNYLPGSVTPNRTHSVGYRDNLRKGDIAKRLLGAAGGGKCECCDQPVAMCKAIKMEGDWPLIDRVQNATFGDSVPMQYVEDKYMFRSILRKAHCFTIDAPTSALISDFSLAVAQDLDAARRLAIPPFPVTWFDIDNKARLARIHELGVPLTTMASRDDVAPRVGWLVHPAPDLHEAGHYLTYCAEFDQGSFVAPLSFFWHTSETSPVDEPKSDEEREVMERLCFGLKDGGVGLLDAFPANAPFHHNPDHMKRADRKQLYSLMLELSGELRHLFGLLIALGAGQLGAVSDTSKTQALPRSRPFEQKGKTLLPLEHKVLTITLSKRTSAKTVAAKAIFHARKRWHEVRGHWRTLKNADGSVKKRVPVKPHQRGDKHLGVIEKTYLVHK